MSQAYIFASEEHGTPDMWGITGRDAASNNNDEEHRATNAILIKNKLFANVKSVLTCDNAKNQKNCGFADKYIYKDGSIDRGISGSSSQTTSLTTIDGTSIMIIATGGGDGAVRRGYGPLETTYGIIYIDTNGVKPPNKYGNDLFLFYITGSNITPMGSELETTYPFYPYCYNKGLGCTAWVLKKENMEYLKCRNLNWNGKSTCK